MHHDAVVADATEQLQHRHAAQFPPGVIVEHVPLVARLALDDGDGLVAKWHAVLATRSEGWPPILSNLKSLLEIGKVVV